MKKNNLLLSLGSLALVTTPIILVASCSSPETVPTLDTETAKFAKEFPVKDAEKSTTSFAAAQAINIESTPKAKWDALAKLVELPSMDSKFSYDIKGAKVEENELTSLKVMMTITQISNSQSKEVILTVVNLSKPSALELEAVRFTTSTSVLDSSVKTTTAMDSINKATSQAEKLKAIKELVRTFPDVNPGFTLTINTASVDTTTISSINIDLTITQDSDKTTKSATFTITGLTEVKLIDIEAQKFAISLAAKDSTLKTTSAIRRVTESQEQSTRLTELMGIVPNLPTVTNGFSLSIDSAKMKTSPDTSIEVTLTIKQESDGTSKIVLLTITGLTAETWVQELTRLSERHLNNQIVRAPLGSEIAVTASAKMNNDNFDSYYEPIILANDIAYTYVTSTPLLNTTTVYVTVQNTSQKISISHTFSITGFKQPTTPLELEAVKIAAPLAVTTSGTKTNTVVRNVNDAIDQATKLKALKALVTNFPDTSADFTLTINLAKINPVVPTSVDIYITITPPPTSEGLRVDEPANVIFTVTGLIEETPQAEMERLATTLLVDANVLSGPGLATSPIEAQKAITSTTILAKYYKPIYLGSDLGYAFESSKVNEKNPNILDITVIVTGNEDTRPITHVIKLTFPVE